MEKEPARWAVVASWRWELQSALAVILVVVASLPLLAQRPIVTRRVSSASSFAVAPVPTEANLLQPAVERLAASLPAHLGVYIEHLPSGAIVTSGAHDTFRSASLYKLFVARAALAKVDAKEWSLGMIIDAKRDLSLAECLDIMITVSDNPCGQKLLVLTGIGHTGELAAQGYSQTHLGGMYPTTTPGDVARFFQDLRDGKHLSRASNRRLMALLEGQRINTRLPQELPAAATVAHKTGDLPGVAHDAGIVQSPAGDYVVVLMSDGWKLPLNNINAHLADFSKEVYGLVNQLPKLSARQSTR